MDWRTNMNLTWLMSVESSKICAGNGYRKADAVNVS